MKLRPCALLTLIAGGCALAGACSISWRLNFSSILNARSTGTAKKTDRNTRSSVVCAEYSNAFCTTSVIFVLKAVTIMHNERAAEPTQANVHLWRVRSMGPANVSWWALQHIRKKRNPLSSESIFNKRFVKIIQIVQKLLIRQVILGQKLNESLLGRKKMYLSQFCAYFSKYDVVSNAWTKKQTFKIWKH